MEGAIYRSMLIHNVAMLNFPYALNLFIYASIPTKRIRPIFGTKDTSKMALK